MENKRVKIGEVGLATIMYQQSLHRQMFGCNAPSQYRGDINERLYIKLDDQILRISIQRIDRYFCTIRNKHGYLYRKISNIPNIPTRILYNAALYFISYSADDDFLFRTHDQLKYSLVTMVLVSIENTYLRTNDDSRKHLSWIHQARQNYSIKFYDTTYSLLEDTVQELLENTEWTSKNGSKKF